MKWNSVCFDLDNTLFSHERAFKKAMAECFQELIDKHSSDTTITFNQFFPIFKRNSDRFWGLFEKKEVSAKEYRRRRFLETMKELDLSFSKEDADWFHKRYYEVVDNYCVPYEGLSDLLHYLHSRKVNMGIITNGTADTQYNKLEKLQISDWITKNQMVVSEEVDVAKPDKKIFDLAKETFGLKEPVLFVGDSWKHDVVGPIEAGWDSIFMNTRGEERQTVHSPVAECNTLVEVLSVIAKEDGT
ncbi:HAD family hydrolase [Alteribacter aurantiacus]|uniref:HAD family hydrolase n=1 Tax=Alteribacter aurantiacus TaxID=254410 RepID=UPI0003FBF49D|nr:HAD family hydrolase [Alteribacter aurantiacus]